MVEVLMMNIELVRQQFTVKQYHQMVDDGILHQSDRLELVLGEIINMSPIGTRHASCVRRISNLLAAKLGGRALIDVQNPFELDQTSELQPDILLLELRPDFYETSHPRPEDIFLLIEVADTTVKYDREIKIPLYSKANLIEVWLVDVNQKAIEVYREPTPTGYQDIQKFTQNQILDIKAFLDVKINVDEIFSFPQKTED
jgi:Uma2 family endonuclease